MAAEPGVAPRYHRILQPEVLDRIRRSLRGMNRGMLLVWRLGLGWTAEIWPAGFGRLMVIEHVGRRTGTRYRTPVNFTRRDGAVYCLAGFGPRTDWLRNLAAAPDTAVWLPEGRWAARAEAADDHPERLDVLRSVLRDSGFAARLIGLDHRAISDEALAGACAGYRLVRFVLLGREDAPGGPGDLAWVWWPLGAAALVAWLRRRSR